MKIKERFNHNMIKINKNEILFANHIEINVVMRIMNDKKEKFSIKKEKRKISKNKVNDYIKKHYNESLQNYLRISKTL